MSGCRDQLKENNRISESLALKGESVPEMSELMCCDITLRGILLKIALLLFFYLCVFLRKNRKINDTGYLVLVVFRNSKIYGDRIY